MAQRTAIALLSGGLDSATAAALAQEAGDRVIGLSFDYGQRHRRELKAAAKVACPSQLGGTSSSGCESRSVGRLRPHRSKPNRSHQWSGRGCHPRDLRPWTATRSSLRSGSALPKHEGQNGWCLA
jgi:hypothetical protein